MRQMAPKVSYHIANRQTFETVVAEPSQIAGLYFYQLMDILIDLAYRISSDFRQRPQLYRDLADSSLAATLAKLNASYGTAPNLLSASERSEIYSPIFGNASALSPSSSSDFPRLRNNLLRAVKAFANARAANDQSFLRAGVRTASTSFRDYLLGIHGDSVRYSRDVALAEQTENFCYPILRDQQIAAVFGTINLANVDYPYSTDPSEDILIEQIATQLTQSPDPAASYAVPTRGSISNLQQTALRGAEAIASAINFGDSSNEDELDLLISTCYVWAESLQGSTPITSA
jgi:hypothetical protein